MAEWKQVAPGVWREIETLDDIRARIAREEQAKKDHDAAILAKFDADVKARKDAEQAIKDAAEAGRQAELHAKQAAVSDAAQARLKQELQRAYIESGGHPDLFESAFPALRDAEITRRTQAELQQQQSEFANAVRGW